MEKYKKVIQKNEFEISAPIWNEILELPDGSYPVSNIKDYFEYIIKKYETMTYNSPIRLFVSKIENMVTFRTTTGHHLEFLTHEAMKVLRGTKSNINKDKNWSKRVSFKNY